MTGFLNRLGLFCLVLAGLLILGCASLNS